MKNGRYETYRGREALVYDFEPNPQFKPHTRAESLANKLGGTVWIDVQDVEVARLEARLIDNYRVAGGLLGSVKTGSDLIVEQERVNGEVWLPKYGEIRCYIRDPDGYIIEVGQSSELKYG